MSVRVSPALVAKLGEALPDAVPGRALRGFVVTHALHQAGQALALGLAGLPEGLLVAAHLGVCFSVWRGVARARVALAVLSGLACALTFPTTSNHAWLGVVVSLALALSRPEEDEDAHEARALLWSLPLLALFWAGVQKAAHGYWTQGQFLAHAAVLRADVAAALAPLVDDETLRALRAQNRLLEGAGPFVLPGAAWRLASPAAWLSEVGLPLLAFSRRLGRHLWALALVVVWGLQALAHEWEFALLMTNLLSLGASAQVGRSLRWAVAAGVVLLALARLGVVPVSPLWVPTSSLGAPW
jgi:hypothetical protein